MTRSPVLLFWLIFAPACGSPTDVSLPAVAVQGDLLDYAADAEVCPDTVTFAEDWLRTVSATLLIDPSELAPITYYWDRSEASELCVGATSCADSFNDAVAVYSSSIMNRHELVHAIHLGVWGRRPPLLEEGLATLFDDEFPQYFDASLDAATMAELTAELIEVEDARDDQRVYAVGAYLSYWLLVRHGPNGLTQLWEGIGDDPVTRASFEALFVDIYGETLAEMFAAIDGDPACQVVSCFGDPRPWDGQRWSTRAPDGCADGVVGLATMDVTSHFRTELVEIVEDGVYVFSAEDGGATLATCGASCTQLVGAGDFTAGWTFAGQPIEVWLEPGTYRVETFSSAAYAGYEVVLEPAG